MINKIKKSILKVVEEVKKVTWPKKKEVLNYVLIVLLFSFIVGLYLGLIDWLIMSIFQKFIF
jgi:preprotein translocase subunit SecE